MVPAQSLILTGPTAAGKTALALRLAEAHGRIDIVNADSLLVYRGMDIGTAKPTEEERARVPHRLIDLRDPGESYTAGDFRRDAIAALDSIELAGRRALIVGGSGFYIKALLYGLWDAPPADPALRARLEGRDDLYELLRARDPTAALRIGPADRYRLVRALELLELTGRTVSELRNEEPATPDPRFALAWVDRADEELQPRIEARARAMVGAGLLDETRALLEKHRGVAQLQSVGYSQAVDYLDGKSPEGRKITPGEDGLISEIALATRQLVKRQRTWLRSAGAERFVLDGDVARLEARFREIYE
jgi:tRNA dimethylallyltransferase